MSRISIERPVGVAMGLTILGGVSEVIVDGEVHRGVGHMSIQTPGAESAVDRYEIEVSGGASKMPILAR
jgi:hypothetical protein